MTVKLGDKMLVTGNNIEKIGEVIRITPKGSFEVSCSKGALFDSKGQMKGVDMWHPVSARPAKDDYIKRVQEARLIKYVIQQCHKIETLTFEQAQKIYDIIKMI